MKQLLRVQSTAGGLGFLVVICLALPLRLAWGPGGYELDGFQRLMLAWSVLLGCLLGVWEATCQPQRTMKRTQIMVSAGTVIALIPPVWMAGYVNQMAFVVSPTVIAGAPVTYLLRPVVPWLVFVAIRSGCCLIADWGRYLSGDSPNISTS